MKNIYIIEHLEPELWEWCIIEYKNISKIVGPANLWFTNVKEKDIKKLEKFGKVFSKSVKDLNLKNICTLDPDADSVLTTEDSNLFEYFIFGGILGDNPPRKRTGPELTQFLKTDIRNIGKEQFSTDNAVFVTHEILNGKKIEDLSFQDGIEIKINKIESTFLPYKYPLIKGKPQISKELIKYILKDDKI